MLNIIDRQLSSDPDEIQREAYNAAFYELGLGWYWDIDTYRRLMQSASLPAARLAGYLQAEQPHLLRVYDAGFLVEAIEAAKARCLDNMRACGSTTAPNVNWAEIQRVQIGV